MNLQSMKDKAFSSHINHIGRSLSQGKAVVVVGAGFSRNAIPRQRISGNSTIQLPDWNGLIKLMAEELHSGDEVGRDRCIKSGVLQVAEQFEANRGRPALDDFIKKILTQWRVEPGEIHRDLLGLPWADVLTFNYDSLLEESSQEYHPDKYTPIYHPENLLGASRPRIIKLHGTLPSGPFVITEEDFRIYAQKNPAFVNTARQLMIENTLILIGFSGNDPNFKQIHGWVRDLFSKNSNRVYLCHVNEFNHFEDKLFRDTYHIELLNLAQLAPDGVDVSHTICLNTFFSVLKERSRVTLSTQVIPGAPDWLADVSWDFYAPESFQRRFSTSVIPIDELWNEWGRQRREYPGWLIAPIDIRSKISTHTVCWPDFLKNSAKSASFDLELRVLWELWWRWNLCLEVIPRSWFDWVDEVTSRRECFDSLPDKGRKALLELQLFSIQNHREDLDEESFTQMLEGFKSQRALDAELNMRLLHEECLIALYTLDFDRLDLAVGRFKANKSKFPINYLRQVGLLADLDMIDEAKNIADFLVQEIRRSPADIHPSNIEKLSIEGWALFLHQIVHQTTPESILNKFPDHRSRWRELRVLECDPWERMKELQSVLTTAPVMEPQNIEQAGFDPGVTSRKSTFARTMRECDFQAFQYLRLFDYLGLPHHPGRLRVGSDAMVNACKLAMPMAFKWAVATRIRNDDKTLLDEMGRGFVLRLSNENISWLVSICLRGLKQALSRLPETAIGVYEHYTGRYASYLLQLTSRLTLRMTELQLDSMFSLLCAYRAHEGFQSAFVKWDAWGEGMRRVLFSASREQLTSWLPDLVSMPFAPPTQHDDTTLPLSFEPFTAVEKAGINAAKIDLQVDRQSICHWINKLSSHTPALRCASFKRLLFYLNSKNWNDECVSAFETALWSLVDRSGLPASTGYLPLTYLSFPELTSQNTKKLLKDRLIRDAVPSIHRKAENGSRVYSSEAAINYFIDFANSTTHPWLSPKQRSSKIHFSATEARDVLKCMFMWWRDCSEIVSDQLKSGDSLWINPLSLLDAFQDALTYGLIPVLRFESDEERLDLENLMEIAASLKAIGYKAFDMEVACFMSGNLPFDHLVNSVSNGLLSSKADEVSAAAHALELWATWVYSCNGLNEAPPERLMILLAGHIQYRMPPGLEDVLLTVSRIAMAEWCLFSDRELEALETGLSFLLSETAILPAENEKWETGDASKDALTCKLRQHSALLAVRLSGYYSRAGKALPEIITDWLEHAARDPLPEVRRVLWEN